MSGYSFEENRADASRLAAMLRTIYECPKPTIARVHGDVYAGGLGPRDDLRHRGRGSTAANFCLSETKLGLIPATISPYVIQAMGRNASRRYFLTAEKFDASEAFRVGLVHDLAAPDELDAKVNAILGALMVTSGSAVADAKAARARGRWPRRR